MPLSRLSPLLPSLRHTVAIPVLLALLALLTATGAWAQAPGEAVVDARSIQGGALSLTPYLGVLEDPQARLTLDEVLQAASAGRFQAGHPPAEGIGFGITPSAYWFRLVLRNPGDEPLQRMLEVGYARLSHVSLHRSLPGGGAESVVTGATAPFESRPYAHRFFVFPLQLPAHSEQTYFLRVQSTTAFIVPARLWEPAAFHAHERNDYMAQAWYFGMATAMVLFNLLLFVQLRDRIYIHYVVFALCMAFALAAQNGLVKEFLRLQSPLWSDLVSTFGYSFSIAAGLQFMRHMLDTPRTLARGDRWLWALVLFFLLSPFIFLFTGQTFIQTAAIVYLGAVVIGVAVGLQAALRRQRSAYFFLGAFLLLALGAMTNALRAIGLVPTNMLTANAMQAGSALEMVLLALALADRFIEMRREKWSIQKRLLETQTTLINSLKQSEQALEQRVEARTHELQALNQKLAALSMTDGLTGIANRRHFDQTLTTEWQRAQRNGQPLTLAMIDVDWFKAYNDHFGHLAGDECLRHIARVLAASVRRPGDLVARYGGEEFAFFAPATDSAGVVEIARNIQEALHQLALAHPGAPGGLVTVSIGVAALVPTPGEGPDVLLRRADAALYRAKSEGRNRIVLE
ncbi:MAG: diguanylate cyclase [Giesbergeria sp.]|nr:diguanylate cyclase [Giesbergeria sp.]